MTRISLFAVFMKNDETNIRLLQILVDFFENRTIVEDR